MAPPEAAALSKDLLLFSLSRKLSAAKDEEKRANEKRVAIEEEIIAATGFAKKKGSEAFTAQGDFGSCKLKLEQPVTTDVVEDKLPKVREAIGRALFDRVFKKKYKLVAKELAALEAKNRDLYLACAEALSSKPGKVSVSIEKIEVL